MLATAFNGAVQVVYGLGFFLPALAFGGGRANFLAVVAMLVLGGVGFAAQYGMFKDRRTLLELEAPEAALREFGHRDERAVTPWTVPNNDREIPGGTTIHPRETDGSLVTRVPGQRGYNRLPLQG